MSSNKKYSTNISNTDIIHQSEDGGGFKLTKTGKFIFGAKQQNTINQLNEENYNGTVDVNANNQSLMAVMNKSDQSIDINIGNENINSLLDPSENTTIITQESSIPLEDINKAKDNFIDNPIQSITSQTGSLPDDELSFMSSMFFNSIGEGADGTGFEEILSPEEAQKIIDNINNRSYNKEIENR
jgi:hypothetical protein